MLSAEKFLRMCGASLTAPLLSAHQPGAYQAHIAQAQIDGAARGARLKFSITLTVHDRTSATRYPKKATDSRRIIKHG
jgi:hypothetical protein